MQDLQETWVKSLGGEDPLEEGMATHCSILAWRIPRSEETGELQSMGLQRVGHDWSHLACTHAHQNKCYGLNGLNNRHWFLTVLKAGKYEDQGANRFSSVESEKWKCYSLSRVWFWEPVDCSSPGPSVHGILQANTGVGNQCLLQGIFLTQGSNPGLLHCSQILYHFSHQGSPSSCWGLFYKAIIKLYSHVKERSSFRSFLHRALISLTLLPPKGPCLQIPSHWELRIQYMNFDRPQIFSP